MTPSVDSEAFEILLANMREEFIDALQDRCESLDNLILGLEKHPDPENFKELYRQVHSLKGAGGTYGIPLITTICHQLEHQLTEANNQSRFDDRFVTKALTYVDLLRKLHTTNSDDGQPDISGVEEALEKLRSLQLKNKLAVLVVEPSRMMVRIYRQALEGLPVELVVTPSGLSGLERLLQEPFNFLIVGRELDDLGGVALLAALRCSNQRNKEIPAVLVSSSSEALPPLCHVKAVLPRNQGLTAQLRQLVAMMINKAG